MNLAKFISDYQLKETDAIVLKKSFMGMVDHYVLFMGQRENKPIFLANFKDGIQEITSSDIQKYLNIYEPQKIERFKGNEQERAIAFRRAISRVGETAYNYVSNNCEHFKNWVHFGDNYSKQVNIAGNVTLGTGLALGAMAMAKKNNKTAVIGGSLIILGAILKKLSSN